MGIQTAVGVTTCPREPKTYLATAKSIWSAGYSIMHTSNDEKKEWGSYGNFRRLLRRLLFDSHNFSDAICIFQDDIEITSGLKTYLDNTLFSNMHVWNSKTGIISLYTAGPHHNEQMGWHPLQPVQGNLCYGALAVMMPRRVALAFDANPPNPASLTMTDFYLGEFCKREGLDVWYHSPSFVRHTGDVSAICNDWPASHAHFRNCKAFCTDLADLKKSATKVLQSE